MAFKISGLVTEAQSGLPIPRVLVVAYDRNLLFDDLLGTAETEADGRFTLTYDLPHDGRGPDLFVAVFAPPCRRLIDTSNGVRYGASSHEFFNLRVDPEILIEHAVMDADLDFSDELTDSFEWEVG